MGYPKMETLRDRFNQSTLDTSVWSNSAYGGAYSFPAASTLSYGQVTCPQDAKSGIGSVGEFDLTDSLFSVEIMDYDDTGGTAYWTLWAGNSSLAVFIQANGSGVAGGYYNGSDYYPVSTTYRSGFYRIAEAAGTMYFDYSVDGVTWVNWGAIATPVDVSAVYGAVYADANADSTGPELTFGNVGLVPSPVRLVNPGITARVAA